MRRFYIIICLFFCISLNCYAQFAQIDGAYYHETDGGVKLTYVNPNGCSEIKNKGTFTIPDSVTGGPAGKKTLPVVAIGEEAFLYVKDKTFKLQGGNLVERVEKRAFKGCTKMTGFINTKSLSYIGQEAFSQCHALTSVKISPAYYDIEIGKWAFEGCGFTYLEIGYRVKKISDYAFNICTNLTSVKFENGSKLTEIGNYAFQHCINLWSVSIPDNVTSIGEYAFAKRDMSGGDMQLYSVTIGASVKTIGTGAFYKCNNLTNVIWNVKRMDLSQTSVDVFNNLESIKTFTFGDKVEDIPSNLCQGCKGITSITIPKSVSSVGNKAFANCRGLKDVIWKAEYCTGTHAFDGLPNIISFTFADGVKIVPAYVCQHLTGLTQIDLPETVESIGRSAFQGCQNLKTLSLCVEGKKVGVDAFNGCSSLSTIHNSYKRMEYGYWFYCTDDSDITGYGHSGQFDDDVFQTCKLYVPSGLLEEYKKGFLWHHFVNMIEETSGIEDIEPDKIKAMELERYDINGRMLSAPQPGINIVHYSDGSVSKVWVPNN
ncbi:MAG: leucine-rich repeat protein [Bacteroidales bacterium]|nr:leucine-rich repeat protein [Bacteroidales bacterium]